MPFTMESLIDIESPSEVEISPDGAYVAFVLGKFHKPDKDTPHQKTIQVVNVATREVRVFTAQGSGTNKQPRWSPDSRRLVFVSNRASKDEAQLYLIDRDGGEAQPLTNLRGKVDEPKWSADGRSIAFLYCPNFETDPLVVDAVPAFNRVWILNLELGDLKAVTPEVVHVFEYDWSPDGSALARADLAPSQSDGRLVLRSDSHRRSCNWNIPADLRHARSVGQAQFLARQRQHRLRFRRYE